MTSQNLTSATTPRGEFYASLAGAENFDLIVITGLPLALFLLVFLTAAWRAWSRNDEAFAHARNLPLNEDGSL